MVVSKRMVEMMSKGRWVVTERREVEKAARAQALSGALIEIQASNASQRHHADPTFQATVAGIEHDAHLDD